MMRIARGITYAVVTLAAAVALLAGGTAGYEQVRGMRVEADERRGSLDYLAYNRRAREHVFRVSNMAPGDVGDRLLVIGNDGRRYIQRISLTQDRVENTGFGRALRLQVYDRTTGICLYPESPRSDDHRWKGCRRWGTFDGRDTLTNMRVPPVTGRSWRPRERHVLAVRYMLADWSTNADQGAASSFRMWWRYHG